MAIADATRGLGPLALAIVSLAVVVGVGSIVLGEMQPASYVDNVVDNEIAQPNSPFPTNYTVSNQGDADFERIKDNSVEVVYEDSSAGTNTTLTEGTDYNVYNDEGKIEYLNSSSRYDDYDSSSDKFYNDYTWESSETATSILGTGISSLQTFADFFTVIVVIGIAAVLFVMLRAVRSAGRTVSA